VQYGHFDDASREYVIERPDTPRSWTNYLGSTEFGAIITNNAGGYSFFRSAYEARFIRFRGNSIPMDQPGRYFYVRDRDTGDYWSASWQPVGKPLDEYKSVCRHGTAYTIIESEYSGIRAESTYFVPLDQLFEYWLCTITNQGDTPRRLSLFTYVEFTSEWHIVGDLNDLQFSQHSIRSEASGNMIEQVLLNNISTERVGRTGPLRTWFTVQGADVAGFDTDREAFLGPYRGYGNPQVVEQGRCTGSLADGDNGCGTFQVDIDLAPGESLPLVVMLGLGEGAVEGAAAIKEFGTMAKANEELDKVREYWHSRLGALSTRTPDDEFNSMVNVWNPYNCLITYAWSRAASLVYQGLRNGLGYRDTVQDLLAVMPAIPEEAGRRLELMLTGQYSTGGAMPVVKTFEHKPGEEALPEPGDYRADDCLWHFFTVPGYVKETGDMAFYDKVLPYADEGEDTVLGHLRRAIEFNLADRGRHALPGGMRADWNDCIGRQEESLFITFQVRYALGVYADICERLGRDEEARWALSERDDLDQKIQDFAWDGEWFLRCTYPDGTILGGKANEEGTIFLNAQSWAVISGAASEEQGRSAMDSVNEHLATPFGIMIFDPPVAGDSKVPIGARIINKGQKENAGIFCHPQGWAVMAEALLGRGDRAYEHYRAFMPAAYNTRAEVRQIEPYVHCQSTHSKYSRRFGASRLPWLSGTAAWAYVSATQYLLGIQPDYDGLRIDPCLPEAMPEVKVQRTFRGKRFDIHMKRGPLGKGVRSMTLNGKAVEGNLLPLDAFSDENTVEVELC